MNLIEKLNCILDATSPVVDKTEKLQGNLITGNRFVNAISDGFGLGEIVTFVGASKLMNQRADHDRSSGWG